MSKTYKFPKDFLWGAATSAHQVEGGNFNDWTKWEKENAKILAKEAKDYWQDWQQEKFPKMFEPSNYISGRACDHYHKYEEDFDIAKTLGHKAHRFSIEWSRIEPEEGKFNEEEIEHYRKVLKSLRERGLEPFVTLYHWPLPLWLEQKGGWLNKRTSYYFDRYIKIISEKLFDLVDYWVTLNEPNVYSAQSFLTGEWPPQKKNPLKYLRVLKNLTRAHKQAYKSLHLIDKNCNVGIAKNNICFKFNPFADYFWNKYFLNKIKNQQDFIGLQYYFYNSFLKPKDVLVSDLGWDIIPQGIYSVLRQLKRYNKPIYITENGLADADDSKREKFIKEHLKYVHKAIEEGVDVRGYFYWSLLDNFEWNKGFWPRFGLVEVDYNTLERKVRPSAWKYAEICKSNEMEI